MKPLPGKGFTVWSGWLLSTSDLPLWTVRVAGGDRAEYVGVGLVGGQHDDPRRGRPGHDRSRGGDAVHAGHAQVDQHDVGRQRRADLQDDLEEWNSRDYDVPTVVVDFMAECGGLAFEYPSGSFHPSLIDKLVWAARAKDHGVPSVLPISDLLLVSGVGSWRPNDTECRSSR